MASTNFVGWSTGSSAGRTLAVDKDGRLAHLVVQVRTVRQQATRLHVLPALKDSRQPRLLRKLRTYHFVLDCMERIDDRIKSLVTQMVARQPVR